MKSKRIVIVGCGPKALNILAKNEALKQSGWDVPEIFVLEKDEVGAHWTGKHGYTDGNGVLGISPLKTFNYPTKSIFGKDVENYMDKYSFISYLSSKRNLEKWIDGGMSWITHAEFANYLKWISSHFKEDIHFGNVVEVKRKGEKWIVNYSKNDEQFDIICDGLVFTGPGEITNPFSLEPDGISILDAKNWWKEGQKFSDFSGKIALIGGGISAGAIFESLMPLLQGESQLDWYTRRGLFTRSENFANNQRFSMPDLWQQIPIKVRESFISTTDKGSIDPSTHKIMTSYNKFFQEIICEIEKVEMVDGKVKVVFEDNLCKKERMYDKVILCTGFSNTDFLKCMNNASKKLLGLELANCIEPDLSVAGFYPKLHLPMLSSLKVGIGCATLGSPSVMSDRILSSWVKRNSFLEQNQNVQVKIGSEKGDSLFTNKKFSTGEIIVEGYPTKFSTSRTTTSVQIGVDLHMEPSHLFVKANHSCDPNCGLQNNELGGYSIVAMRNIEKNEEITWDYAMSEWESIALESQKCKCGSLYCRGSIGGFKNLPNELLEKYLTFSADYLKLFQ